jgi:hypothetical protein
MAKRKPRVFTKWSASAIGTVYFDEEDNMYAYDKPKGILVGLSSLVKGKKVRVRAEMNKVI